ncbi:MAG: hypothetical protein PHX70_11280 [Clostridium sp.]|nr:hypothetical protein [Clostridium sp.]
MIKKIVYIFLLTVLIISIATSLPITAEAALVPTNSSNTASNIYIPPAGGYQIQYQASQIGGTTWTQSQTINWGTPINNSGSIGVTTLSPNGPPFFIHGLRMSVLSSNGVQIPPGASITYQVYTRNNYNWTSGWQSPQTTNANTNISNAAVAGSSTDSNVYINAVRITLNNMPGYEVKYQTFITNSGWSNIATTKNSISIQNASILGTNYGDELNSNGPMPTNIPILGIRMTIQQSMPFGQRNQLLFMTPNAMALSTASKVYYNGNLVTPNSSISVQGSASKYISSINYTPNGEIYVNFTQALTTQLSDSKILSDVQSSLENEISQNQNDLNLNNVTSIATLVQNIDAQIQNYQNQIAEAKKQLQTEMIQWQIAQGDREDFGGFRPNIPPPTLTVNTKVYGIQLGLAIGNLILRILFA